MIPNIRQAASPAILLAAITMGLPQLAAATPFTLMDRVAPCVVGSEDCYLPGPAEVPGKEYSNHQDVNDLQPTPMLDPEQNLAWDGVGGREDAFDYSGSRISEFGDDNDRQVDALGSRDDLYFDEIWNDEVWMLISTGDNAMTPAPSDRNIYWEAPSASATGLWASGSEVDIDADADMALAGTTPVTNPMDVDGLEVWGADGGQGADGDHYSLIDDPVTIPGGGRVAVFSYDAGTHTSTMAFTVDELAAAIATLRGASFSEVSLQFDLDAMMVDLIGERLIFSVRPMDLSVGGSLDGGEIFTYERASGIADYLKHGGHTWDTAFDVMGTFDTTYENVDALEGIAAVPAPVPLALIVLGLAGMRLTRRA